MTTTQQSPHWLQWEASNSTLFCPFSFDIHHPHLIHPSLDRPHLLSQTASGSNQSFYYSTLSGHTDKQTDRQTDRPTVGIGVGERSTPIALTLYWRRATCWKDLNESPQCLHDSPPSYRNVTYLLRQRGCTVMNLLNINLRELNAFRPYIARSFLSIYGLLCLCL